MAKDRFYDYLDYCEQTQPVSVGDYIERVVRTSEVLAWTQLMRDVNDTYRAGKLRKIKLDNGGVAYLRNWREPNESTHGSASQSEPRTPS